MRPISDKGNRSTKRIRELLDFLKKILSRRSIIISLFDYSGTWSAPYRKAGCRVLQVESKLGFDVFKWNYKVIPPELVLGILAAPPCTDFAGSGAQYWRRKDSSGTTAASVKLIKKTLEIIHYFNPQFWALENPVGRLNTLVPELKTIRPVVF